MFQFFETIFDLISSVINFFANLTYLVIDLFENALDGIVFTGLVLGNLPNFVIPVFTTLLAIAVVKFVLNFGGN